MNMLHSLFGLFMFVGLAWLCSENRRRVEWRTIVAGVLMQLGIGGLLLLVPGMRTMFLGLNSLVLALEKACNAGTTFAFGYLGGGELPFATTGPGSVFIFAFKSLPVVLLVCALSSLLFHWRILPWIVRGFAFVLRRGFHLGGALGVGVAANIFVGMVEAPLLIRPYLKALTRSELFTLMTSGMATIAGTVLVLYASMLRDTIPDSLGHILTASIISAPAAVLVARLMIPETGEPTAGDIEPAQETHSAMDAVVKGTTEGMRLLLSITALLIVFVALVALVNQLLGWLPNLGGAPLSMERLLGWIMAPVVWLMGISWSEAQTAGMLMGTKTILNELLAYAQMAHLPAGTLSPRSELIMTYALCGFANLGSLGVMIGGIGGMCPERRDEVISLGLRSIIAGTLATCMTGAVAGILL